MGCQLLLDQNRFTPYPSQGEEQDTGHLLT